MADLIQYLSAKSARNPSWSSKDTVAYVSNQSGVPQIWETNIHTGKTVRLSSGDERTVSMIADAKAKAVLFTMDLGGDEQEQIFLYKKGSPAVNLTKDNHARNYIGGISKNRLIYSSNARDPMSFDIMAMDMKTGKTEIIIENHDHYNMPAGVSPDGRYFAYHKLKGLSDDCLYVADIDAKTTELVPANAITAAYGNPCFKSDGSGLYYTSDYDGEFASVYFYDLTTKANRLIYKDKHWDVDKLALSSDDKYLAMVINEDGYSKIKILNTLDGSFVNAPNPPQGFVFTYGGFGFSPKGHILAFALSSGKRVMDVWILDLDSDKIEKITHSSLEGIDPDDLIEPILDHYTSFDGLKIPYWLFVPKGKKAKDLALMIEIHGGPEGQEYPVFEPVMQYLLSRGIAIAAPNVRGSTGYGKTYSHLDDKEKRLDSVKDIEWLIKHLVSKGIAKQNSIAVSGTSYGGFMTLSCAARLPHLFCAAVDNVGMFNLATFLENTSGYRRAHRESEYGVLATQREMLESVSPAAKVDDITGPLMIIHGANDPRVPVSEAEAVVAYLRGKGVEVKYLRYEDEGHGLSKLKNRLDCYPQVCEFLLKYMDL